MKKLIFISLLLIGWLLLIGNVHAQIKDTTFSKEEIEILEQFKKVSDIEDAVKRVQESAAQQIQQLNDQRSACIGKIEYIRDKFSIDLKALEEKIKKK